MTMTIKNDDEIRAWTRPVNRGQHPRSRIERAIAPGVTTADLDAIARDTLAESGAVSSFLGYHGFPGHICASVNDEIVHGIPGNRRLRDGDIVSIDVGAILAGFHGDSAWTYGVGQISGDAAALLRDTEQALLLAVEAAMSGNRLGAIGHAVESHARRLGRGVCTQLRRARNRPANARRSSRAECGRPDRGVILRSGLTLAIEPMLTLGSEDTRTLGDGWTVVTADGSRPRISNTRSPSAPPGACVDARLAPVLE